jgi:hypothetical protein
LGGKKSFQQNHGASATGTRRRFAGKGRSFPFPIADRLEPCQRWAWIAAQGQQDSFKQLSVFGMKEAVVADLDKAFGQDMLEEAGEKNGRWQGGDLLLAGLAVTELEADLAVVETEEAAVGEGEAVDVRSEVLENGKAVTGRAAIDYPILFPDVAGSEGEEVGLFQGVTELGAEEGGQSGGRQEEVFFREAPASFGGDTAAGDEAVEMRVIAQVTGPGLQDSHHADLAADKARVPCQLV